MFDVKFATATYSVKYTSNYSNCTLKFPTSYVQFFNKNVSFLEMRHFGLFVDISLCSTYNRKNVANIFSRKINISTKNIYIPRKNNYISRKKNNIPRKKNNISRKKNNISRKKNNIPRKTIYLLEKNIYSF